MTLCGGRQIGADSTASCAPTSAAQADCWGNRQAVDAYDEYGIPNAGNAAVGAGGRFGYTGQMWLPELGLWYYKARMYSPTLGRFMQTDPIGYGDGVNWYDYVGGDPVNFTDPSGLISRKACRGTIDETNRVCITSDPTNAGGRVRREPLDWEKEGDDIVVTGTRLPSVSISGLLSAVSSQLSGMAGASGGYLGLSSPQRVATSADRWTPERVRRDEASGARGRPSPSPSSVIPANAGTHGSGSLGRMSGASRSASPCRHEPGSSERSRQSRSTCGAMIPALRASRQAVVRLHLPPPL